jgi:hypothetical protein
MNKLSSVVLSLIAIISVSCIYAMDNGKQPHNIEKKVVRHKPCNRQFKALIEVLSYSEMMNENDDNDLDSLSKISTQIIDKPTEEKKDPRNQIFSLIEHKRFKDVEELINNNFNEIENVRDKNGNTVLHHIVLSGSESLLKLWLDNCGKIFDQNERGETALHLACNSKITSPDFDANLKNTYCVNKVIINQLLNDSFGLSKYKEPAKYASRNMVVIYSGLKQSKLPRDIIYYIMSFMPEYLYNPSVVQSILKSCINEKYIILTSIPISVLNACIKKNPDIADYLSEYIQNRSEILLRITDKQNKRSYDCAFDDVKHLVNPDNQEMQNARLKRIKLAIKNKLKQNENE